MESSRLTRDASGAIRGLVRAASAGLIRIPGLRRLVRALARRHLVPAVIWRHLPASDVVSFAVAGREVRCALPDTDGVARELDWIGPVGDEAPTIRAIADLASKPGQVIDVGANVGLYSVIAGVCSTDPVRAYEPVPRTFAELEANLERNRLTERVALRRAAVGATSGRVSFHVPFGESPSSASLSPDGYRGLEGELIDVDVVRLDDEIGDEPIALVKIDVEGHEHEVLDGMVGLLSKQQPPVILESNHDGPTSEVEARLRPHGYVFLQLRPDGPTPVDSLATTPDERFRNFLCVPAAS